jgi:carbon storage regulator
MLVTRRRVNESILLGESIEVKVLEIGTNWVKLGVVAPRDIPVVRHEVALTREENRTAAAALGRPLPAWLGRRGGTLFQAAPDSSDMSVELIPRASEEPENPRPA